MSYAATESVVQASTWGVTSMFYMLLVPAIVLWYTYWRMSRRHFYELASKIPGPEGLPIFGNALDFTGGSADIFRNIIARSKEYEEEPALKLWIGPRLIVFLYDPRDVELILSSHVHIDKAHEYKLFEPWLGNGLLISTGQKWRSHRKLIAPTFHLNVLKSFIDLFNANSRAVVEKLKKESGEFDCHDYMSECTVEILLGMDIDSQLVAGGVSKQARQALLNLKYIVEAGGGSLPSVIKTTILLADINDFTTVNEIYAEFFPLHAPVRATFQVGKLPKGAAVEIDAIALVGDLQIAIAGPCPCARE